MADAIEGSRLWPGENGGTNSDWLKYTTWICERLSVSHNSGEPAATVVRVRATIVERRFKRVKGAIDADEKWFY